MKHTDNARLTKAEVAIVGAGLLASGLVALSMTGTLAAFTAQIQNTNDTAASGSVMMTEKKTDSAFLNPTITCASSDGGASNSATCATIDKYGGTANPLMPGSTQKTYVTIGNTGSSDVTAFTLTPGACSVSNFGSTQGGAADPCSKFTVKITVVGDATQTVTQTASQLASGGVITLTGAGKAYPSGVPAGATAKITFEVGLDATADNTYAGYKITQPLTWNFSA